MTNGTYAAAALILGVGLSVAGSAVAGGYERMFFVKPGATAAAMFDDRDACAARADQLDVEQERGYTDAEFGALAAMASALEADGGSDGKVRATVRRVALERCMERLGWTLLDPKPEDAKAARKAGRKRPEGLDAWLKANEPKPPPAPEVPALAPAATPNGPVTPPETPSSPPGSAPAGPT